MLPVLKSKTTVNFNNITDFYSVLCGRVKKYLYKMSPANVEDTSAGPAYYINDAAEVVTVPAQTPLTINGEFINVGSWKEYCANPLDPGAWTLNSATVSFLKSIGAFYGYAVTDTGAVWNSIFLYESLVSGNPTGRQTVSIFYDFGTSGSGVIILVDLPAGTASRVAYSNGAWSVTSSAAGNVTIKSDIEIATGLRKITLEIAWTTPTNTIKIAIGPNSTTNKNIIIYGASVNDIGDVWPVFNPTGGTTVLSRAGVTGANTELVTNNYKLLEALGGKVSGENLVPNGDFSNGSTGWVLDSGWSVVDGVLFGVAVDETARYATNSNCGPYVVGALYELSFDVLENTLNGNGFGFSLTDALHTGAVFYNRLGKHVIRRAADASTANTFKCVMSATSTTGTVAVTNFSVKRVTEPAQGKITFDWTPRYASTAPTVNQTIFKLGSVEMLFDAKTGSITLSDGTTPITKSLTSWADGDILKFKILYGANHPSYPGVSKKQFCVSKDGGATWLKSSITDFDGSFMPPGTTTLTLGDDTLMWGLKNFKVYDIKSGDWA